MNLLEYENSIFGDVWNEQTIKELKESAPPERREYTEKEMFPDIDRSDEGWEIRDRQYECWHGTRFPQWM